MATTIKDVAKLANTSIATVSKVLNNKDIRVSDQKRLQILEAARILDYIPSSTAVGLQKGSTDTIGIIVPDLLNPFYPKLIKNFLQQLSERGKTTLIFDSDETLETEFKHLNTMRRVAIDGLLFVPSSRTRSEQNSALVGQVLDTLHCPVVYINKEIPQGNRSIVSIDRFRSGYIAAEHLISLGHQTIGYLSEMEDVVRYNETFRGFEAALDDYGLGRDACRVAVNCTRYLGGYEGCREVLAAGVTALFAESDQIAIGAMAYAAHNDVQVPRDLSVVGMNDVFISRVFPTPLTTVRQEVVDMCRCAIDLLFDEIEANARGKEHIGQTILIEPKLRIRESSAPPKQ